MSARLSGWRLSLRLAARDARRARARSLLVLVMIALPVTAVSVADTAYSTSSVSAAEGLDRRLGDADALLTVIEDAGPLAQDVDPDRTVTWERRRRGEPVPGLPDLLAALDGERRGVPFAEGWERVRTEVGVTSAGVIATDLADPMTEGLFTLTEGRLPETTGEVLVNADLAGRLEGDTLAVPGGGDLTVVGTAESARYGGSPWAFALTGSDLQPRGYGSTSWLVDGGPVTWDQVRSLNADGVSVLSRSAVTDPPPASAIPAEVASAQGGLEPATLTVLVLVVVMVLIEIVLLAGPAFAVGARRQARTLALVAASGGTPAQARRVVLASAVVLGVVAAALGVGLGVAVAWASMPVFQSFSDARFGPFEVQPLHLVGIAGFGLLSAFLAAVVPAALAARQDVVAVLAGRRGDTRASRRSPLLGLLLLGLGVAGAGYGASAGAGGGGEIPIAVSAILSVLGMILLVPVVVVALARVARRLPLALRFAARDAARHRTRTVPAVAAVAATVAGVVALGIAVTSDEAQNRETYVAQLPVGSALVVDYRRSTDYDAYAAAVAQVAPRLQTQRLVGLDDSVGRWTELRVSTAERRRVLGSYGGSLPTSVLVAESVPGAVRGLSADERRAADSVLAGGGVLAFTDRGVDGDRVDLVLRVHGANGRRAATTATAALVEAEGDYSSLQAVVSPAVAEALSMPLEDAGIFVPGPVSGDVERDLAEAVGAVGARGELIVERGYVTPDETVIVQLVLAALGAVLMLGGTLTATFLALSDARPDLATLSAVGATPGTRRGVAAAYALVVALVGAVLGALVGAVPGVAITYPLTGSSGAGAAGVPAHFLDVPWLLVLGVVVGLPLLTSAVVGLTARSRLPLAARLE